MNSSLYYVVRSNELDKLFFFLKEQNEKGNNVKVYGFDPNFSGDNTHETFTKAIQANLNHVEMECKDISLEDFSKHFKNLTPTNLKRSEERRVGKESKNRCATDHEKK